MSVFFAVVLFALCRALLAGYGGMWFAPVVAMEALAASWPFLLLGAAAAFARRSGLDKAGLVAAAETVLACALLVSRFGHSWVEPHTSVAAALALRAGVSWQLLLAGCALGIAAAALGRRRETLVQCALVAFAGWLIVGPEIYAGFDDVMGMRRLWAASAISAAFAGAALLCWGVLVALRRAPQALDGVLAAACASALLVSVAVPGPRAAPGDQHAGLGSRSSGARASVVLVAIDTLRADALERTREDGSVLMPRLAEIARSGVRFTQAVASAPWTLPSMVSLLSGMNPHRHRTGRMNGFVALPGEPEAAWSGPALRAAGYQVAAFVNNPWLRPYYGVGRGYLTLRRYHGNASDGVEIALDWLVQHTARPSFMLLHLMDPHWPYAAPAGYGEPRRECAECDDLRVMQYRETSAEVHGEMRRRYDAEVSFTDAELGRFWDELARRGVLEHTWFVVTSDHGEEFWEHYGFLHGHSLYDELLRVPLVIVPPSADALAPRGVRAREQVRLEDVAATIFEITGVVSPVELDGTSLFGEFFARDPAAPIVGRKTARPQVAGYLQQDGNRAWAVRANGMKLIGDAAPLALLFDLRADAREAHPITFERPAMTAALAALPATLGLQVGAAPIGTKTSSTIDTDLEQELRALGYLD